MNDNDIVKALECCTLTNGNCTQCPLNIEDSSDCFKFTIQKHSLDLINRQNAKIARLKKELIEQQLKNNLLYETAKEARTEAIKEFADRLKEIDDYVSPLDIDNLVKEMTEATP